MNQLYHLLLSSSSHGVSSQPYPLLTCALFSQAQRTLQKQHTQEGEGYRHIWFYCTSQMLRFYKLRAKSSTSNKITTQFIVILALLQGSGTELQYS